MWRRRAVILHSQITQSQLYKPPWISSLLHYSDAANIKGKAAPLQERRMRDRVTLWVKGGEGGKGCYSYRRTRTDRYGKPDGGNGGRGGDVILECSAAVWDFSNLQHHLNAKRGGNGTSKNRIGNRGSDKVAQVPVGTVIHLVSGEIPSFLVDTSIKSLQPWDIPDTDQSGPSKFLQYSDNSVSSLSDEEAADDSSLQQPKDYTEKSARLHRKISETPGSTKARKGKANSKDSLSGYESYSRGIHAEEYDIYEYDNCVSSLSDEEATDDSSLQQSEGYTQKSARLHRKISETPGSTKARKGKANSKDSLSGYKSYSRRIQAEESDIDEHDMKFEEENEEDGEDDEEYEGEQGGEYMEEYEEEEDVQYSVAELTKPGQRLVVARGGDGGLGNVCLRKEPKHIKHRKIDKHDDVSDDNVFEDAEDHSLLTTGRPGSESVLILELKSIADVGLVGMPNAGKSTLLGAISRAKPTVGHYAFTTLRPNIGNLNYDDFFSVTVADIPGLIKGAHANRGLGHAFLRHIERTKVLAYVVDLAAALDGRKGIPPWEQLRDLVSELEHHQEGLSHRPSLIVANKIDEEGADDVYEELKKRVQGVPIFPVCAVLEEGVPELKTGLRRLMDGSEPQCLELDRIILD